MAETVSLAVLENLVHMARGDFPSGYVVVAAIVPDRMSVLAENDLIGRFGILDEQRLGDQWIDLRMSAVLAVRSRIVPLENNYLLNPLHPDFARIRVEQAAPFVFDERLFWPGRLLQ